MRLPIKVTGPTVAVGFDVGGTFTDLVLVDYESGKYVVHKVPTSPADPSEAIVAAIGAMLTRARTSPRQVSQLHHGTTVATNAILQGTYASTALVTTRGFRDVIELARTGRPHHYNLDIEKPNPIVPRWLRFEITERIGAGGELVQAMAEDEIDAILEALSRAGVDSVAVCFLHAYVDPTHERHFSEAARRKLPHVRVSSSSDVSNEFREYERFTSTVLNAALLPVMANYLESLESRLRETGIAVLPQVMQSNGGLMSARRARERPIGTFLSGPAAGVIAAANVASQEGFNSVISVDMGGTSTDVSLITDGRPALRREQIVAGLPVKTPTIDINTVGAGGGSIAWVDSGGLLKVGPKSAGAIPGPACYGHSGVEPTLTDADLSLGRLGVSSLLGGRLVLDAESARAAIAARVGIHLRTNELMAAAGIVEVAISNVVRAIRAISVERGHDPREHALIAFGGAGPMHAAEIAAELGMTTVLIPTHPGLVCAMGLLESDLRTEFSATHILPLSAEYTPELRALLDRLESDLTAWSLTEGLSETQISRAYMLDVRYVGQDFELEVEYVPDSLDSPLAGVKSRFDELHKQRYGYSDRAKSAEIVAARLAAIIHHPRPQWDFQPGPGEQHIGDRDVWFKGRGCRLTPVLSRGRMPPGSVIAGPAVLEQLDATTVVPPGMTVTVRPSGVLVGRFDG